MRALPGVEAAGASSYLPFSWDGSSSVIIPEGYATKPGESVVSPNQLYVSPGYLEAHEGAAQEGRFFTDVRHRRRAAAWSSSTRQLAKKFWPNQEPVGQRMYLPDRPDDVVKPGPKVTWLQVVGVVGSVKMKGLEEGGNARVGAYYAVRAGPVPQHRPGDPGQGRTMAATQAAVKRALAEMDPEVPLTDIFAMSERIEQSLNPRRAPMLLSLAFGGSRCCSRRSGMYGVLAYQVSQRTREIGIRMALGSDARGDPATDPARRRAAGGVGLRRAGGAVALRGVIASQLYGVGALDPMVMAAAVGVLGLTSLVACWGPARRAAKVSPLVALSRQ